MNLASNLRVPELVSGVDVRGLPLSALEGFVLSRIDGHSTTGDIVSLTGLPLDQVLAIVDKLIGFGAVRYRDDPKAFDAPSASRAETAAPPIHGAAHARRRVSHAPAAHPRRMLSESAISSPPPEAPSQSGRPHKPSHPAGPHKSVLPPSADSQRGGGRPMPAARVEPRASVVVQAAHNAEPSAPSTPQPPPQASSVVTNVLSVGPDSAPSLEPSALPGGAPLYDPRELEEEADLPLDRRKQLLDLFYQLPTIDYYEALGVAYTADKKEIRSAYFGLSKRFHPDTLFRKNLSSFKPKMEAVFKFLTEAYETLGKKKARDEYDAYLRATKAARMAERALTFEPTREPAVIAAASMQVPPPPLVPQFPEAQRPTVSSEPPTIPMPTRAVSPEARKLAQEVIARRLRGVQSPTRSPMPASSTLGTQLPAPEAAPAAAPTSSTQAPRGKTDTQSLLAHLTRTLRDVGQVTGSKDRVTRAVRASLAAVERGDLTEATQQAARAASLAPDRPELKAEHARLSTLLSERLANDYIEQAKFEMKQNKWASAALTWSKVCEGRPQDASAHRWAAHSLLKGGGDMRSAQRYAQKAVFLAPTDIDARILLAQICLTVGLKLNARRELDAAAKLDPANEIVKNLLADLEKG